MNVCLGIHVKANGGRRVIVQARLDMDHELEGLFVSRIWLRG